MMFDDVVDKKEVFLHYKKCHYKIVENFAFS